MRYPEYLLVLREQPTAKLRDRWRHPFRSVERHGAQAFLGGAAELPLRPREVVRIQEVQLLERQGEPERVAGGFRSVRQLLGHEQTQQVGVQLPVIPSPDLRGNLLGVLCGEWRQIHLLDPGPLRQGVGGRAGKCRGDDAGVRRPLLCLQPGQVLTPRRGLDLIQRVEQDDHAGLPGGPAKQREERGVHVIR